MSETVEMLAKQFHNGVVAQDDDNDYSESGYVVLELPDGRYAIGAYSHCSCYDTLDSLCANGSGGWDNDICRPTFLWTGTLEGLQHLAITCGDPTMPDRAANPEDYDYDHLCAVYSQIKEKFPCQN